MITELIVGFMLPGKPVAMMMFKTYGYITMAQGEQSLGFGRSKWQFRPYAHPTNTPSPSHAIHRRLQAWALHEGAAAAHVLVPDRRDDDRGHRAAGRAGVVRFAF